jgi:hypothetical protein
VRLRRHGRVRVSSKKECDRAKARAYLGEFRSCAVSRRGRLKKWLNHADLRSSEHGTGNPGTDERCQPSADTLVDDSVAAFSARSSPIALHLGSPAKKGGARREGGHNRRALELTPRREACPRSRRPGRCECPTGELRRQWTGPREKGKTARLGGAESPKKRLVHWGCEGTGRAMAAGGGDGPADLGTRSSADVEDLAAVTDQDLGPESPCLLALSGLGDGGLVRPADTRVALRLQREDGAEPPGARQFRGAYRDSA